MSTILKALDRLERDRETQDSEVSLRDQITRVPKSKRGFSMRVLAVIALFGATTGAGVAAWWMADGAGEGPAREKIAPSPASAPVAGVAPRVRDRTPDSASPPPVAVVVSNPAIESAAAESSPAFVVDSEAPTPASQVAYGTAELPAAALQSEVALVERYEPRSVISAPIAVPAPSPTQVPRAVAWRRRRPRRRSSCVHHLLGSECLIFASSGRSGIRLLPDAMRWWMWTAPPSRCRCAKAIQWVR